MKIDHTPLPWVLGKVGDSGYTQSVAPCYIWTNLGRAGLVATTAPWSRPTDRNRADAVFIHKACNAYQPYRQERILTWAIDTFGEVAKNPHERAARLVEEAIEVAQAVGLPLDTVDIIAGRVYSRPPGELAQEIGNLHGVPLHRRNIFKASKPRKSQQERPYERERSRYFRMWALSL